mgnify:CR=1 FL=1
MFDFLRSEDSKLRHSAAQWLELAQRIHDYRKDQLPAEQTGALVAAMAEVAINTAAEPTSRARFRLEPIIAFPSNITGYSRICSKLPRASHVHPFEICDARGWGLAAAVLT